MKLRVSLSEGELAALDKYARAEGLKSRSAAIRQAIRLLGDPERRCSASIGPSQGATPRAVDGDRDVGWNNRTDRVTPLSGTQLGGHPDPH